MFLLKVFLTFVIILISLHLSSQNQPRRRNLYYGCTALHKRGVLLTFDDGPSAYTLDLLDTLKRYDVKAIFFMVGSNVALRPDIVQRVVSDGHALGSHTYSHANLTDLHVKNQTKSLISELEKTEDAFFEAVGLLPAFFRPTDGEILEPTVDFMNKKGYNVLLWSSYLSSDIENATSRILHGLPPGSIIRMHESDKNLTSLDEHLQNGRSITNEIVRTEEAIKNVAGFVPAFFRPPYGELNQDLLNFLSDRGYATVMWSSAGTDWYLNDMTKLTDYVLKGLPTGGILCLHDINRFCVLHRDTTANIDTLLNGLHNEHWQTLTPAQCFPELYYKANYKTMDMDFR